MKVYILVDFEHDHIIGAYTSIKEAEKDKEMIHRNTEIITRDLITELDKQSYLLGVADGREEGIKQGTIRGLEFALETFEMMDANELAEHNSFTLQDKIFRDIKKLITKFQDKK